MDSSRRPREGQGEGRKRIAITECEVVPVDTHGFGFGVRGLATVTLNNALIIRSIRVVKNREGEFSLAYPAQMGRDKTWYSLVEPKSDSLREEIARRVIADYGRAVERAETEAASSEEAMPKDEADASEAEPQYAKAHHQDGASSGEDTPGEHASSI